MTAAARAVVIGAGIGGLAAELVRRSVDGMNRSPPDRLCEHAQAMAFLGRDTTARSVNEFLFDDQGPAVPGYGGIMVRVMSRTGGRLRLWGKSAPAGRAKRKGTR
jgi:hypothetical protein